jgi:hypothetical protein
VTGDTTSNDFPLSAGAPDASRGPSGDRDSFVTKLSANGRTLLYSTYLGGSTYETAGGIAVDGSGNAYVTGFTQSADFPTSLTAFDHTLGGTEDAYATKLNATGTSFAYSTLLGGSGLEEAYGIAVDGTGNAFVSGDTSSADFPTTAGAYDRSHGGNYDAFVTKFGASGMSLGYSTFVGSDPGGDVGRGIALDSFGAAYVLGSTDSAAFPTTDGTYDATFGGGFSDAVFFRIAPSGSDLTYSTYLGGSNDDYAASNGIATDPAGNAYVVGPTRSADYPVTPGAYQVNLDGGVDGFVTKVDPTPFGYVRPKSAAPLRSSLVVAYKPCTAPNRVHGPPLAFDSCSPPDQASSYLTVGTPDANGQQALSEGWARYDVLVGNPSDPESKSDVKIAININDVRQRGSLLDYSGQLELDQTLRITDRQNGSSGNDLGTMTDIEFPIAVPCNPTGGSTAGSYCAVGTSANALTPGAVTKSKRAIWQIGQVRVYDGGPDGVASTADNTLFETQGVFIP